MKFYHRVHPETVLLGIRVQWVMGIAISELKQSLENGTVAAFDRSGNGLLNIPAMSVPSTTTSGSYLKVEPLKLKDIASWKTVPQIRVLELLVKNERREFTAYVDLEDGVAGDGWVKFYDGAYRTDSQ